jgi:hypothetical protein
MIFAWQIQSPCCIADLCTAGVVFIAAEICITSQLAELRQKLVFLTKTNLLPAMTIPTPPPPPSAQQWSRGSKHYFNWVKHNITKQSTFLIKNMSHAVIHFTSNNWQKG